MVRARAAHRDRAVQRAHRRAVGGRLFVDGRLPSAGAANLRLDLTQFQVADALGLLQSDVPATGLVSLGLLRGASDTEARRQLARS